MEEAKNDIKVTIMTEDDPDVHYISLKCQDVTDTNLQREDDHCKAHNCCDAHCHDHWLSVMEAGDHSHHVGHTESQDGL